MRTCQRTYHNNDTYLEWLINLNGYELEAIKEQAKGSGTEPLLYFARQAEELVQNWLDSICKETK